MRQEPAIRVRAPEDRVVFFADVDRRSEDGHVVSPCRSPATWADALWATWTRNNQVYVNTTGGTGTWGTPFVIPASGTTVSPDDISSVVSFSGNIGVMWSNQVDEAMYFAVHRNGDPPTTWTAVKKAVQGSKMADDQTRPILMLSPWQDRLWVFATTPVGGGTINSGTAKTAIYYKTASMSAPSFAPGKGTPFIQTAGDEYLNNPTSTKQVATASSGVVVLASDNTSGFYAHGVIAPSANPSAPETTITSGPPASTPSTSATFAFSSSAAGATFACSLDGASFSSCASPASYSGLTAGSHAFAVRATSAGVTDPTPATRTWTIQAPMLMFTPTDDATIDAGLPATGFGFDTRLTADADPQRDFLLKFTVAGTGSGTGCPAIAGAKLRLTVGATANVSPLVTGNGTITIRAPGNSTDGVRYFSKDGNPATVAPQLQVQCA